MIRLMVNMMKPRIIIINDVMMITILMTMTELKSENFPSEVLRPTCFPQSSSQVPQPTYFQEQVGEEPD